MRLSRLGAFHPTRISFARTLIRRMARENWQINCSSVILDGAGKGTVIYHIMMPETALWFVVFADHLDAADRTDRVIAEKWDTTFTLTTAEPTEPDLERLRRNVPLQEAGRCSPKELVLSRANKSVRLFEHVVDALARGEQPSRAKLREVGYLVRTTAVYGNGKFGLADFALLQSDALFRLPFQAEMLCVFLARQFSLDWVEHIARRRDPQRFVPLASDLKRSIGVGNATGLGMAPFLVGHPKLICRWIWARETALARVRSVPATEPDRTARFHGLLDRAVRHVAQWQVTDDGQRVRNIQLLEDLEDLRQQALPDPGDRPWDAVFARAGARYSVETQELVNSILIELHPELVDDLEQCTGSRENMPIDAGMTLARLQALIEDRYRWALDIDFSGRDARALFWYRSEEKEEPRLGMRFEEPGAEKEMPIAVARDVAALRARIAASDAGTTATFLLQEPEWRETVRRVQALAACPFAEVRDNLIDRTCRPIDLLRCKLAIFGAVRFDPKSDLWTRITLFQGAPLADRLDATDADDWAFPYLGDGIGP